MCGYTLCQVVGFPCVGDYRDSGLLRRVDEPAAVRPGQLSNAGQIAHVWIRRCDLQPL
jgi:hypothetical protein